MVSPRADASLRAGVWVTLCAVVTAAAAGCYLVGQQAGRLAADDVPRAMSARAAGQLSQGMAPSQVVGASTVDLVAERSPFVIVYDQSHGVLAGGASVGTEPATLPPGVLDAALSGGEDHVSWQPSTGVREAVVAVRWGDGRSSGVVVAGASLEPTETRARALLGGIAIGWLVAVGAVTLVVVRLGARRTRRPPDTGAHLR